MINYALDRKNSELIQRYFPIIVRHRMQDSTVTLIVGIAGILGTLISSAMGFYFTAKERRSAYQEALFKEQVEIVNLAHKLIGKSKNLVSMFLSDDPGLQDFADSELQEIIPQLAQVADEGAAVLPTEVWIDLNQYVTRLCEIKGLPASDRMAYLPNVSSAAATFALASRKLMGVDELSMNTFGLLSGSNDKEFLDSGAREAFLKLAKKDA